MIAISFKNLQTIVHGQMFGQMFEFPQPIFTKNQAAFRKLYSTIRSVIACRDSWYSITDRREVNLAIFLNLRKAFDAINHSILLAKLEKYHIRGITDD